VDFHGPHRTYRHTQLTTTATIRIELDLQGLAIYIKGPGGANRRAKAAMNTEIKIALDLLTDGLDLYPEISQIGEPFVEILGVPGKLYDHEALFTREDSGLEDVEGEVKLLDQPVNDGLIDNVRRKTQDQNPFVHGYLLVEDASLR
jgi:hypothetical protein